MKELINQLRLKPEGIKKSDVIAAFDFIMTYLYRVETHNGDSSRAYEARKMQRKLYDAICTIGAFDEIVKCVEE